MAKDKNKKVKYEDDGRTIANMNFDTMGISNHKNNKQQTDYNKKRQEITELKISRKEQWAMIKAMYIKLIPVLLIMFVSFFVIFFILFLIMTE